MQENLVYVMGLAPRIADNDILRRPEYFGKFGRILKVAVSPPATASQVWLRCFELCWYEWCQVSWNLVMSILRYGAFSPVAFAAAAFS